LSLESKKERGAVFRPCPTGRGEEGKEGDRLESRKGREKYVLIVRGD